MEDTIRELCACNGVPYERLAQEGPGVERLEIFFSGYPRMVGLSNFPNLTVLTLVNQDVRDIEGLHGCRLLRELWIAESHVTVIKGLEPCRELRKLYLYSNNIARIEGLESLPLLEVLWLNNNCIAAIENLHCLQHLKELNLADNQIEFIGHSLDSNLELERLNLSGNKISSFKELTQLSRLPALTELSLQDPLYAPCSVSLLCNYATHLLYHLPQLRRLDTIDVSSRALKDLAESTVAKKMVYYGMRIHVEKRSLALRLERLNEARAGLVCGLEDRLRRLHFVIKNVERELLEADTSPSVASVEHLGGDKQEEEEASNSSQESSGEHSSDEGQRDAGNKRPGKRVKLQVKLKVLQDRVKYWCQKIHVIDLAHAMAMRRCREELEQAERRLAIELESGGNVRFESCGPDNVCFTSCQELLLSRFCAWDFYACGATGVRARAVTRVHNRALRQRFDERVETLRDRDRELGISKHYHKLIEYLFCVWDPDGMEPNGDLLRVVEDGFPDAETYWDLGKDGAVTLANSLSLSEGPRIEALLQKAEGDGMNAVDPAPFRYGQLLVVKVYLGRSAQARELGRVCASDYPNCDSIFRPRKKGLPIGSKHAPAAATTTEAEASDIDQHGQAVSAGASDGEQCCLSQPHGNEHGRECECALRQCLWFVPDRDLVLPEYIIDLEYVTQKQPCVHFSVNGKGKGGDAVVPAILSPGGSAHVSVGEDVGDENVLSMPPTVRPRPKLISLDEASLLSLTKTSSLNHITVLNLHGNSLTRLKDINRLVFLRRLVVSFNELARLDDLTHMPNLEYLDVSHNQLGTLEGMKGLSRLCYLDISWNRLSCVRDAAGSLRRHACALVNLDTRHNPWLKLECARLRFVGQLRSLASLDGVPITEEEVAAALRQAASSHISQALLLAHACTEAARPRCLSLLPTAQLLEGRRMGRVERTGDLQPTWYSQVTSLCLDGLGLTRLTGLERMESLRWASFCHNELCRLDGLEGCLQLAELSVDHNRLSTLHGLHHMTKLVTLSIDCNELVGLEDAGLEGMPRLARLSAASNRLASLAGLQRCSALAELYVASNHLASSRDVYRIKGLTNLVILDLHGNPLASTMEQYRLFVIFHLPALKALDGNAVELAECDSARDTFGGRLTSDLVAERLGHADFIRLQELSLPALNLRTVDLLPLNLFVNLRNVNLEQNNLSSFSGLIHLSNVQVLNLNYNQIESVVPRARPPATLTGRQQLYQKVASSGYGPQNVAKATRDALACESLVPVMERLEVLHLAYNRISSLVLLQLGRLTGLRTLYLQGNEISRVEGLEGAAALRELVLDANRVRSLGESSFLGQGSLVELHLRDNRLRQLSNLHPLCRLQRLYLDNNKLQDMSELEKLNQLPSLTEITLTGNPLARRCLHRPVLVLQTPRLLLVDGLPVSQEERVRAEMQLLETQTPAMEVVQPGLAPLFGRTAPLWVTSITATAAGGVTGVWPLGLGPTMLGPTMHGVLPQAFRGGAGSFPLHTFDDPVLPEPTRYRRPRQHNGFLLPNPRSYHAELALSELRPLAAPVVAAQGLRRVPSPLQHGATAVRVPPFPPRLPSSATGDRSSGSAMPRKTL
ncbi:leucine-rich repeat-containing protein 9 [Lampetra planeri]